MVAFATEAVAELPGPVRQSIDNPVAREKRKCPVDRREPDRLAAFGQPDIDLLCRGVVWLRSERAQYRQTLPGRAESVPLKVESLAVLRLRRHSPRVPHMRMKTVLVLVVGVLSITAGCGGSASSSNGKKRLVAAFYPLAFAAERIGGHGVDVTNLTPPGVEPHDLEASPGDVQKIQSADLVLLLGHGFQPQLEAAAGNGSNVELLLDTPGLNRFENGDPHVWLDPARFALIVERIGSALHERTTTERLVADLRALDREYRNGLAHCARHEIVTSHEAFAYLAQRYGLQQIGITGLSPEAEPTPGDLQHVIDVVRKTHATTVFFETLLSPRIADTVARETHTKTAVLDPIEGLTPAQAARGEDYFSLMRANLRALRGALGCR